MSGSNDLALIVKDSIRDYSVARITSINAISDTKVRDIVEVLESSTLTNYSVEDFERTLPEKPENKDYRSLKKKVFSMLGLIFSSRKERTLKEKKIDDSRTIAKAEKTYEWLREIYKAREQGINGLSTVYENEAEYTQKLETFFTEAQKYLAESKNQIEGLRRSIKNQYESITDENFRNFVFEKTNPGDGVLSQLEKRLKNNVEIVSQEILRINNDREYLEFVLSGNKITEEITKRKDRLKKLDECIKIAMQKKLEVRKIVRQYETQIGPDIEIQKSMRLLGEADRVSENYFIICDELENLKIKASEGAEYEMDKYIDSNVDPLDELSEFDKELKNKNG